MFKRVNKMLLTIALTGWMGVANATLIFDFSYDSSYGKISGEILGLLDNVDGQAASAFIITDLSGITVDRRFEGSNIVTIMSNMFDVRGGELVKIDYKVLGADYWGKYATLHIFYDAIGDSGHFITDVDFGWDDIYDFSPEFTIANRVTVPEPDSVILVLLGLAGLSFARYRKQS
jgi:hypothetical protein